MMAPMNRPELLDALRPHPALDALRDEPDVYVVGGAVRDALLGRPAHELDLLVEGDAPAVARRAATRLGGAAVLHERFGTATVTSPAATFDLVSSRTERYPQPGALPEVMPGATVEQDLERRDMTINAMALHLTDARFLAHPRADEDLVAGVLRVLHDASFRDDPTRMLRAARYAARLGFAVEPHTDALWEEAVRDGAPSTVSGHRLGDELRLLLREPQPAALLELRRHGLGQAVLGLPFNVHVELVPRAMELTPRDGRADLVALAACIGPTATGQEVSAALDRLEFTAAERGIVKAAVTARLDEWPLSDDELWRRLRNR